MNNDNSQTRISLAELIPKKYQEELVKFIEQKKFGTFCFIIQKGNIVGCDITNKDRTTDR
jgi:hypothetical protein